MTKYVFIAGGVMSGIGKGVATASIGRILKSKGFNVQTMKIDPYINIDAGTMNPTEHGEVFVTYDGTECDQDIGNYERFLGDNLTTDNYLTTGKIYQTVIAKERNLGYGGKCVEVIPHIPEEVIRRIKKVKTKTQADFILIEIGGTVGEYQNLLFLETARMLKLQHPDSVVFILVSYLPIPKMIGEMKTKPTQYAARTVNAAGIQPDLILARSSIPLDEKRKKKISVFCNISEKDVISAPDVESIYEIPLNFEIDNLGNRILKKVNLNPRKSNLQKWQNLVQTIKNPKREIKIGIVGKYFKTGKFTLVDSYISVIEAVKHASYYFKVIPKIVWLDAEQYEQDAKKLSELKQLDGVIVPGGFGNRGVEGKIKTIEFCRKEKIPFLGLCLGMQLAVIEFARNVCKLKKANSTEFCEDCQVPVIDTMSDQKELLGNKKYGGTMRLGTYACKIIDGTLSKKVYASPVIFERHRHRYEFNNKYKKILEEKGLITAGINPDRNLVEIVEIKTHPFFVAAQFHPEFKSRPLYPHPLFKGFAKAALQHSQS